MTEAEAIPEPIPIEPDRWATRGRFPVHHDGVPPRHGPHPAREALRYALERWYQWRRDHE